MTKETPSIQISEAHLGRIQNVEISLVCLKEFIDLAGEHHQGPQDHYGAISTLFEPIIAEIQEVHGLMYFYEEGLPDKDPGPVFELKKGGAV